jgi:subtilisin family serine protease
MPSKHSHLILRKLTLAVLASLPLLASAQTIRGFSVSASPSTADNSSKSNFRTVSNPIAGRYIVVLKASAAKMANESKPKLPAVVVVAEEMTKAYGANLIYSYDHVLRGFAVEANDQMLAQLLADPRVEYVEEDALGTLSPAQTNATWGLDRSDQRNLPLNGTYNYDSIASNVHAYVIDTGLRASHQEFENRIGNGFTITNDGLGTGDCNGHGTHVAGTIGSHTWGLAKGLTLHPVRIGGCGSGLDFADVIKGVDWVAANHIKPAVANMSLGGPISVTLDSAVNNLISAGVTVVVAAGNAAVDACQTSPANVTNAITVGATDQNDARSIFGSGQSSNFGNCLDLFAPGSSITSVGIASDNATKILSGTSMASPHVAGAAALYLANNPSATPAQVASALINNATPNKVTNPGNGSPNRLLYIPGAANIAFRPGLSGAWYNPNTNGQGLVIDIDAQLGVGFAGWYTFDVNGGPGTNVQEQRWYTLQGLYAPGDTVKTFNVYRNTGGNFDAPPITQATEIGTATLSFQSCATGRLDYQITADGQNKSGTIPLTRIDNNPNCASGNMPSYSLSQNGINASLSGPWHDPQTSGQGVQFLFSPANGNLVFVAWYTYDVNGQSGTGPSSQRWYTLQGNYTPGSTQVLGVPIYETTGGRFDASPPTTSTTQVGTANIVFNSCTTASMTYNIPGRPSRTIPLTRLLGGVNCTP